MKRLKLFGMILMRSNERVKRMKDNEFAASFMLTFEALDSYTKMSEADKQLLDNAVKVALMATKSAAGKAGVKASIALYHIGAFINKEAAKLYAGERSG